MFQLAFKTYEEPLLFVVLRQIFREQGTEEQCVPVQDIE